MLPQFGVLPQMPVGNSPDNILGSDSQNVNILYQQPQLIPIIEQLIQQEQQKQQQQQASSSFSQRSFSSNSPIEIETLDSSPSLNRVSRLEGPSQFYTIQAMPRVANLIVNDHGRQALTYTRRRR